MEILPWGQSFPRRHIETVDLDVHVRFTTEPESSPSPPRASLGKASSDDHLGTPSRNPGDQVTFSVFVSVDLLIDRPAHSSDGDEVHVIGPEDTMDTIARMMEGFGGEMTPVSLHISPRSAVTVPMQFREGAGIPLDAEEFAFIYPTADTKLRETALGLKNMARNSWVFVMKIGGFSYYGSSGQLISVNSMTLADTPASLLLVGPFPCAPGVQKELELQRRIRDVAIPEVKDSGFVSCAWAHPSETFRGTPLSTSEENPHGAFVYTRLPPQNEASQSDSEPEAIFYKLMMRIEVDSLGPPP